MTLVEYAKLLRPLIEKAVQSLSDNDALKHDLKRNGE